MQTPKMNGYIGILQRPIKYSSNRSKMLKENDFRFYKNSEHPSDIRGTTDEPYIIPFEKKGVLIQQNPDIIGYEKNGKIYKDFKAVEPTGLDAYASKGSTVIPQVRPSDKDFRHYLFFGEEEQPLLQLKYLIKNEKSKSMSDFGPHSVGFSKKKENGGFML